MRSFDPGAERWKLEFLPIAEREFAFLLEMGCRVVEREVTLLRYQCSTTYVKVYHARGGFYLGAEVGLREEPEVDADLSELMAVQGVGLPGLTPAETVEAVRSELPKLARLFREHAGPAVEGQRWIFEAVDNHRRVLTARYMEPIAGARMLAEAAWDRGDRETAAKHYAEIESDLTAAERDRLASLGDP
ncbi:MAG: hypothetical protein ACRDF7_05810 [Candidatus Limnocylindrales bacterium]